MSLSTALWGYATLLVSTLAAAQEATPAAAPVAPVAQPAAAPTTPEAAPVPVAQPPVVQYQTPQGAPPPPQGYLYVQPNGVYEPPAAKAGDHLHDGFYLRLAIGFGYLSNTINLGASSGFDTELKVTGTTLAMEVLLGGAVIPGLILGAGIWADPLLSPKFEVGGASGSINDNQSVQLSRLGLFVDIYPDPKSGFHVQGNVGLAAFSITNKSTDETLANAKGLGLGGAVGYEWWVSQQWGAGVMARFTYSSLSADGESHRVIYPSILISFTFN